MKIEFPQYTAGIHPPTAALTRILAHQNVLNPQSQSPFTEAAILGMGGGLDTGYVLYHFKHLSKPHLSLGFRNQWNDARGFLEGLTSRLVLSADFMEFGDQKKAEISLQNTLQKGQPAIVWVDKAGLPYHHMATTLIEHLVTVYARDSRLWRLYLDDLTTQPYVVKEKAFTTARASIPQYNFLMMTLKKPKEISPTIHHKAIVEGIQECATRLTRPLKTIGISNLEVWAEKLVDRHDPHGWPIVFKGQVKLFPILSTIYEAIKLNGTEGFALRKLYSDFLHEAAGYLGLPQLNAVAGQYLQLSNRWSNLADNALPSSLPEFDRYKKLLNKKYAVYQENNDELNKKTAAQLNAMEVKFNQDFPLDGFETNQLLEKLSSHIKLIAELEMSAAHRLREVIRYQ